jgi:putative protease
MEEKRPGEHFPVYEDDRGTYVMSSKDLCMIEHLSLLAEAGVDSFKIEGRMKGINYVAGVTKVYREATNAIASDTGQVRERWLRELAMFSSRGYTTGMFFGRQADADYNFDGEVYRMSHELVGIVLDIQGPTARVGMRNRMNIGDAVEYLTPGIEEQQFAVTAMQGADRQLVDSARNEDIVYFDVPDQVRPGDLIRRPKQFRGPEAPGCPPAA